MGYNRSMDRSSPPRRTATPHIMLVDDDALLRRSLGYTLGQAGYRTSAHASAEDALASLAANPPDLVLLDIGLPGMDGLDALRALQQRLDVPVIFVTARRRELEQVLGLELGADDYITKPFDPDVLLARIKAVLRRSRRDAPAPSLPAAPLVLGDLAIDPAGHTVTVAGVPVDLAPREFDLLLALACAPGRVLAVDELLQRVWGADFGGEPQVVYVHVRRLREKIEPEPNAPRRIVTVRGVGYKFVVQG